VVVPGVRVGLVDRSGGLAGHRVLGRLDGDAAERLAALNGAVIATIQAR
jgi:hypothetical protein